jgi:HAD superfamily hydrolase (TIGR01509 family)
MIQAVIFDMDGLLIDSEPLWQEAELKFFGELGVPLTIEMTRQTMGLRTDEVVDYWYARYPWKSPSKTEVRATLDDSVVEMITKKGQPKPGVSSVIDVCMSAGLPMAIASSSPLALIHAVVAKLGIDEHISIVHSAHDETHGKPHPAVYITAAGKLGVAPTDCLAFEDSVNGVLSAKAAKMKCVAVPEAEQRSDKRFGIADVVIGSLADFDPELLKIL